MSAMLSTSPEPRTAVTSVITHHVPADDWQQAFDIARSGRCGKVLIDWS